MRTTSYRFLLRLVGLTLLTLLIGSCALQSEKLLSAADRPTRIPAHWTAIPAALPGKPDAWLHDFDSPELTALVKQALAANIDLAAAAARVKAAGAQAIIAGADRLPQLDLELDGQRSKGSLQGSESAVRTIRNRFTLEATAGWEIDLWGRLAHLNRAALADAGAVVADYRAARLSLAAQVARAWFTAIEAKQQTRLSNSVVGSFRRSLEATEARYRLGIGSSLDVRLSRANVAGAEADLAQRQRELDTALRNLDALLGRYPEAQQELPAELPSVAREVPAGLPAQLLRRRPDLIAARERLFAASERRVKQIKICYRACNSPQAAEP